MKLKFCDLHVVLGQSFALWSSLTETAVVACPKLAFARVREIGDGLDLLAPGK